MPAMLFAAELLVSFLVQYTSQLWHFLAQLHIPLPIGLIGLWRWGVWLLRRVIGTWYQPSAPNHFHATTTIVTPVYNEDPELFRAALRSWAANQPTEIIAVIDHTDTPCMEQFREFEAECAGASIGLRMLITETPGKRPALADGILAATNEIVFLVDSDTIWDADLLPKALAPFAEGEVGGVTIRQRVLNPATTAQRLFDLYLDIRYIDEIRFLTAFGDAVTCLSGRTAVYRRAVALTALEDLMEETFWGRPVISGDDKALTLAVQSRGWKVRYQSNTCVYTPGATEMKVFLKQRLRWARNSWRADLKALCSKWAWCKPLFAFHLCDRLLQPLTTLVAPLYMGFALYQRDWTIVAILLSWWALSRTVKMGPHLQRRWTNIRILPWYIFFTYWSAVMKIYAFFTMNQQGWITRWSRGSTVNAWLQSLRTAPSYLATAVTVSAVAFLIQNWHEPSAMAPTNGEIVAANTPAIQTESLPRPVVATSLQLEGRRKTTGTASRSALTMMTDAATASALCVLTGRANGTCRQYQLQGAAAVTSAPLASHNLASHSLTSPPLLSHPQMVWQQLVALWDSDEPRVEMQALTSAMLRKGDTTEAVMTSPALSPHLFCVAVDDEETCVRYDIR